MVISERYLHFDNINMEEPDIAARCSSCGRIFTGTPGVDERVDDVLLRIRKEFNAHECPPKRQTAPNLG